MAAERAPEPFFEDGEAVRPNLYIVPTEQLVTKRRQIVERQTGVERTSVGDVLINVIVEVDEREYPLCVNISRRTLGNGQPISTYFERFENRRQNADGTISGDFGRADTLAEHALYLAEQR